MHGLHSTPKNLPSLGPTSGLGLVSHLTHSKISGILSHLVLLRFLQTDPVLCFKVVRVGGFFGAEAGSVQPWWLPDLV